MASLVFRQPVDRNVNAKGFWVRLSLSNYCLQASTSVKVDTISNSSSLHCSNYLLFMVYNVAGAQAGVQVVVNQVAGAQVLDQVT